MITKPACLEAKEADEITVDKKSEKDKKGNMSKKTNNRVKRNSAMDWAFRVIKLERRFTNITILEADLSRLRRKQR